MHPAWGVVAAKAIVAAKARDLREANELAEWNRREKKEFVLEKFLADSEDAMASRFYTYSKIKACEVINGLPLEDISQKDLNRIHAILSYIKDHTSIKLIERRFKGLDDLIAKVDAST